MKKMGRQVVRKTMEIFECDKCGREGQRYTVLFEDGTKVLDRCDKHNAKLEALRNEDGEWRTTKVAKATFHKSTPEEIQRAIEEQAG